MSIAVLALGWAYAVAMVTAVAIWRLHRHARVSTPTFLPPERVLLVRPCAGDEPGLEAALLSVRDARRSWSPVVRVAVESADDPARPAADRACALLRTAGLDAAVVVSGAVTPNRKVGQVAAIVREEEADVLIVADSDVDLGGADLDALVAPFGEDVRVGAVWSPPTEQGRLLGPGDRAARAWLAGSLHSFPLLSGLDRRGLVGKLVAIRTRALEDVGGLAALERVLGEDVELARRLRAGGWTVVRTRTVALARPEGRTFAEVVLRATRWLHVVRQRNGALLASYPLLFFPTVPILVLAGIGAAGSPPIALAAALLSLCSRAAAAVVAARAAGERGLAGPLSRTLLADVVLALAFVRAARSRSVWWRGRRLVVARGGQRIEEVTS